jgi:hypothetical protein
MSEVRIVTPSIPSHSHISLSKYSRHKNIAPSPFKISRLVYGRYKSNTGNTNPKNNDSFENNLT